MSTKSVDFMKKTGENFQFNSSDKKSLKDLVKTKSGETVYTKVTKLSNDVFQKTTSNKNTPEATEANSETQEQPEVSPAKAGKASKVLGAVASAFATPVLAGVQVGKQLNTLMNPVASGMQKFVGNPKFEKVNAPDNAGVLGKLIPMAGNAIDKVIAMGTNLGVLLGKIGVVGACAATGLIIGAIAGTSTLAAVTLAGACAAIGFALIFAGKKVKDTVVKGASIVPDLGKGIGNGLIGAAEGAKEGFVKKAQPSFAKVTEKLKSPSPSVSGKFNNSPTESVEIAPSDASVTSATSTVESNVDIKGKKPKVELETYHSFKEQSDGASTSSTSI